MHRYVRELAGGGLFARRLAIAAAVSILLPCSAARAGTFDLNVSDDAIRAEVSTPLSVASLELDFGWLHADGGADVPAAGLHVVDYAGARGSVLLGVGARFYYVDLAPADGGALTLGGFARVPLAASGRAGVRVHLYYAPDASAFGDLTGFLEYGARAFYQVIEPADVYVGYRRLRARFSGRGRSTVESGIHFGLRLSF